MARLKDWLHTLESFLHLYLDYKISFQEPGPYNELEIPSA